MEERWKNGYDGQVFGEAISKYGNLDWTHEWIASSWDEKYAIELEALFISLYNTVTPNGYNVVERSDVSPMIYETTLIRHRSAMKSSLVSKVSTESNKRRWKENRESFLKSLNSEEVRKKKSEKSKAFWANPENKARLLELRKQSITEEYRKHQSEIAKSIFNTDEQKVKRSIQALERWSNKEYASKQSEAIRNGYRNRVETVGEPRRHRYRCLGCGMESTACGIGNHQKKTTHIGKEKI